MNNMWNALGREEMTDLVDLSIGAIADNFDQFENARGILEKRDERRSREMGEITRSWLRSISIWLLFMESEMISKKKTNWSVHSLNICTFISKENEDRWPLASLHFHHYRKDVTAQQTN